MDNVTILIPVYEDWDAVTVLLAELDAALKSLAANVRVLLVNDGSPSPCPAAALRQGYVKISRVEVLHLKRNLGHQGAICVGLAYLQPHLGKGDAVLIMDADGEDRPDDARRLLDVFESEGGRRIVFARRTRRSEGLLFRLFYVFYRAAFFILTGERMRYGNFCVLAPLHLAALVLMPEVWLNLPAAIIRSRLPFGSLPSRRGTRYAGRSKMTPTRLLLHGLSSICIYNDVIAIRLLVVLAAALVGLTFCLAALLFLIGFHPSILPIWIDVAVGLLVLLIIQTLSIALNFVFTMLGNRVHVPLLPARDAGYFVGPVEVIFPADAPS